MFELHSHGEHRPPILLGSPQNAKCNESENSKRVSFYYPLESYLDSMTDIDHRNILVDRSILLFRLW